MTCMQQLYHGQSISSFFSDLDLLLANALQISSISSPFFIVRHTNENCLRVVVPLMCAAIAKQSFEDRLT